MAYYTSVHRYGNQILYRGYSDKHTRIEQKIKFKPTLYTSTQENTGWKSLYGNPVKPVQFESMSEARAQLESFGDVSGYQTFGNTNYVAQYLAEKFPDDIKPNLKNINIGNIDIEVASDDGFPHPDEAMHPIISIAYKSSKSSIYHAWGLDAYDPEKSELDLQGGMIKYCRCEDERELLLKFLTFWIKDIPDVITGWNIRLFDIPYIIHRIIRVIGEKEAKFISPWKIINKREIGFKSKKMNTYEIYGVSQMDYFDLFQKFEYSYGTQESYSLDHISHTVLGETKLSYSEYGSLHLLYKNDYQKFIDYNIRDVFLVHRIDQETDLMNLALTMAYKAGVNYSDTFGTTGIWDSIIYRYLHNKKIAVPPTANKTKTSYPGGYVKNPKVGKSSWITSFDLNSLYPNLIVQYNMSPETLVRDDRWSPTMASNQFVDHLLDNKPEDSEHAIAANGAMFRKDKRGIMPEIVIDFYDQRKIVKKKMIAVDKQQQLTPTDELKRQKNQLNNEQMSLKILLNSLYGALGNAYFRYFELDIAEGITLSGQLAIRWAEKVANKAMNDILRTDNKDYVIAIDTDSIYVEMADLVKKYEPKDPVAFLDKVCSEKFTKYLAQGYDKLYTHMNAYDNRMVMEREVIADCGVWTAKKRYILNVHNSEGVQYSEPKIKIMGIEAVKSSTPQVVRDKFKEAYKIILTGTEAELQKFVSEFYNVFCKLPPEDVSFPRGVSAIRKWHDKNTIYTKSTPIHVRGALLFNKRLEDTKLNKHMEKVKDGTKVKFCYLRIPNPIMENIISFPQYLPQEFGLHEYVDYDLQFSKTFKEPLSLVTNCIDWHLEKRLTLEAFFG